MKFKPLFAPLFSLFVLQAGWALAQTSDPDQPQPLTEEQAEQRYEALYRSFEAAKICRKLDAEALYAKVTAIISQKTENKVLIGHQLSLIDKAKREAKQRVKRGGCDGPEASEDLGVYDAEIAPLL
jgi:hypothetical protein